MEPGKSTNSGWANLPLDLGYLITRKLSNLPDFVRFRAVCKAWCASAPVSDPPLGFPWILEENTNLRGRLRFFCPSTGKVFTLPLPPQLQNMCCAPSPDGYLIFCERNWLLQDKRMLFNPLTNHLVNLPFVELPLYYDTEPLYRRGDYVVFSGTWCGFKKLAFFRLENKRWIKVTSFEYTSCCLSHDGLSFSYKYRPWGTRIVDTATNEEIGFIESPKGEEGEFVFLIESFGEILKVVMTNKTSHHIRFRIYKLAVVHSDDGKLNHSWVQTDCIGDCVLFLSRKSCVSVKASQFYKPLRNCIYYRNVLESGGSAICQYSIKDGETKEIPSIFENWQFFVPNLHHPNSSGS
ncbi:F-box family protein [Rhynchospora pubera]|uniref:F-box family protein n=1 Tax=Rhynchospora pubera TaxID=906938 RepID=A0AAV8F0X2_9POAL|nr:F-box family protein [Rhynchospora pubera]